MGSQMDHNTSNLTRKGPGLKQPWIRNVSNPTEEENGYGNETEKDSLAVQEGS